MFRRIALHFKIDLHVLECCTYEQETGMDVPIGELPDKLEEAFELGKKLGLTSSSF
jgi:hypothetical protein